MEKIKRIDGSMSYHRYCSKCHRLLLGTEAGCNFCSNCGHKIKGSSQKAKKAFQEEQKIFEKLYKTETEAT